jgi:hypothetical protein
MARRILAAVVRAARENLNPAEGHFHAGAVGRAYPCYDPACARRSRT